MPDGAIDDGDDDIPEVDLAEYLGVGPRDRAALAPNWRSPLRVDLVLGLVGFLLGVWLLAGGVPLGALAVVGGGVYIALVVRRWHRWATIRRQAGLI